MAVLDAGAGTGFTTEGIVARVEASRVTMLDQSPHQLARSRAKPALADCPRVLGDAENLPFDDDTLRPLRLRGLDRVLAGPAARDRRGLPRDPRRRHRADHRPGAPGQPRRARSLAETWMLFPAAAEYTRAGWRPRASPTCARVELAPDWYRDQRAPYALAVSGVKPAPGPVAGAAAAPPVEEPVSRARFAFRFVAGSAAGFAVRPDRRGAHAPRPLAARRAA